ncbi:MAG: ABC transporter ATP-binding protein [Chloroflexi bacterium]|nr:ABC transporter ATP-binding protein [Chloroflexota bacterium]
MTAPLSAVNPVVEVAHLSVTYTSAAGRQTVAVDDVSFDVGAAEFVTLIGPSGCGKSTVLNVMCGLQQPGAGSVRIAGTEVSKPLPRVVGVVFQDYTLFPWRSVLKNVEVGLEFRGVPAAERREQALHYLQLVGLQEFGTHLPRELSGGMKQRVAIARALSLEPQVLLMDEPFGALDEQTRIVLGEQISTILERTGKTIVFVTHSLAEAAYLSDRILVMTSRPGRIKASITAPFGRPRSPDLMLSPEFNQLRNELFEWLHDEIVAATAATTIGAD